MFFGYATLVVAFILSAVAAYYSVLGLVAIFSSAAVPVIIMGGALETGKVIAAMWLHRNWHRSPLTYKLYLLPSLLALMLLTSMGTFGYLSKAHSDQSLVSGDVLAKISIYDEKIKIAKDNIDANRAALRQLDAGVDQTLARSTSEQGAERSVQIRRQQGPERQRLLREIETEQKKIAKLNEERAPISAEVRKVEAEVGPIKYIAALIYGDNPEANLLESAVRWVIILIVVVFDPLAIVLILAGTRHLEWERKKSKQQIEEQKVQEHKFENTQVKQDDGIEIILTPDTQTTPKQNTDHTVSENFIHKVKLSPQLATTTINIVEDIKSEPVLNTNFEQDLQLVREQLKDKFEVPHYVVINDNYVDIDGKAIHVNSLRDLGYGQVLKDIQDKKAGTHNAKTILKTDPNATFGLKFPPKPNRGHLHVYTGSLPSKLYSYNGSTWVEEDKKVSNSYTSNEAYIKYLIDQLTLKELTLDDLTDYEKDIIQQYIENAKSTNNSA